MFDSTEISNNLNKLFLKLRIYTLPNIMPFVQRHNTKGNPEIIRLCQLSAKLYNRANYLMRQSWFNDERLPDINILVNETKSLDCFRDFGNTKTAKQIIRKVLTDWSNFRAALRAFQEEPKKFVKEPKPPGYKEKMAQVVFYNETIKGGQSNKILSNLTANNGCFSVPFKENYKQVVITPKAFGFVIDVQYETKKEDITNPKIKEKKLDKSKLCCIDPGVNVLAAITIDQTRPVLVNGRIPKSINQKYNKKPTKKNLEKRYWSLENYFHHTSKLVVELAKVKGCGTIVIGKNDGWKENLKMRKKDRQAFRYMPFCLLWQKIQYKAVLEGIDVIFTEEAYTSKASFYDRDDIPKYDGPVPELSGRRVKRGLYVSDKLNLAINADVNGSMNIGRKIIPEFLGIGDRSLAARPARVNPLKGDWRRVIG